MLFYVEGHSIGFHLESFDEDLLYKRELGMSWDEILHEKLLESPRGIQEIDALIKTVLLISMLEPNLKRSRRSLDFNLSVDITTLGGKDTPGGWNI